MSQGSVATRPGCADLHAGPARSGTIVAVDVAPETGHRPGQPRSQRDAAFLERYNTWMQVLTARLAGTLAGLAPQQPSAEKDAPD
jgi:hypothetical protein